MGKPHGLMGEVYVEVISDDPERFSSGSTLVHENRGELVVESTRAHGNRLLVKFQGVEDRTGAERLRGVLYVSAGALRELGDDEYWEHDLVGARVIDVGGRERGEVVGILPAPAQDLLRVATPSGERLVPLVADIVVGVDVAGGRVTIDPPSGLLDG